MKVAVVEVEHDVVDVGLELVGGQLARRLDDEIGRAGHGRATGLQRTRSTGTATARDLVGVALVVLHAIDRDTRALAGQHHERGAEPLAVRRNPGADDRATVVLHLEARPFAGAHRIGDLDVGRHADPEQLRIAGKATRLLLGTELGIAGRVEHTVDRRGIFAAVVRGSGRRGVRERIRRDHVAPAEFARIHADLRGVDVDHALDRGGRLGAPRTAVGTDRRGVGEHGDGFGADLVDRVGARCHQLGEGRQQRRQRRVAAALLDHFDRVREEPAVTGAAELCVLGLRVGLAPSPSCSRCASRTSAPAARACTTTTRRASSSGDVPPLAPNEPPTSGVMMRTCEMSRPLRRAMPPCAPNTP